MGRKTEVSIEKAQRCLELRRQGWPYAKVGREVNLDRRVVARVVEEQEKAKRLQEVASARREVAGAYLREHIQSIEAACHHLLELALPPYLRSELAYATTNVEGELLSWLKEQFFLSKGYIPVMGHTIQQDYPEGRRLVDACVADREAKETIQALREHLPSVWPLVDEWERLAGRYNAELRKSLTELERLGSGIGISPKFVKQGMQEAIKLIHKSGLFNDEEPLAQHFGEVKKPVEAAGRILQSPAARQEMKRLAPYLNELGHIFNRLQEMLSPSHLRKSLIAGHCNFCPVP